MMLPHALIYLDFDLFGRTDPAQPALAGAVDVHAGGPDGHPAAGNGRRDRCAVYDHAWADDTACDQIPEEVQEDEEHRGRR